MIFRLVQSEIDDCQKINKCQEYGSEEVKTDRPKVIIYSWCLQSSFIFKKNSMYWATIYKNLSEKHALVRDYSW